MYKTVVFCSTQPIPNESFPQATIEAVARSFAAKKAMGCVLKSKSGWKQFLSDAEISEIVLVGVDNPSEYEVPLDDLTPMLTDINGELVQCNFQVVDGKGILLLPETIPA